MIFCFALGHGCGEPPVRCEVTSAGADPTVLVLGDLEVDLTVVAETTGCDPEADHVKLTAVIAESYSFEFPELHDRGTETDAVAGDGRYERTMINPFDVGRRSGEGFLRFEPCDPHCHDPAVEVPIRVDPAPE
jgi:hypothetical protein